jgi:hypothetical protein
MIRSRPRIWEHLVHGLALLHGVALPTDWSGHVPDPFTVPARSVSAFPPRRAEPEPHREEPVLLGRRPGGQ